MAKAKAKSTTKKVAVKKATGLRREIPTLHSLVIILYILLGIFFLIFYLSRQTA